MLAYPLEATVTVSVIIPTHNPNHGRLRRALNALRSQTIPPGEWETVLVDNASSPAVDRCDWETEAPPNLRVIQEPQLGLSSARRRGFQVATAPLCVLVDDDNVLAPDYLEHVVRIFTANPGLGAIGGRSVPEFESPPADWQHEFLDLLALRDLGAEPQLATALRPLGAVRNEYPACAPIGAGMALRRNPVLTWATADEPTSISDRRGAELTSGGDNDIVFSLLQQGWHVGYFPQLQLTHLIPSQRLMAPYLARLNHDVQKSWVQVLSRHEANPWPAIPRWSIGLRKAKAWWASRAWRSPAAFVRWRGRCGRLEGQAWNSEVVR